MWAIENTTLVCVGTNARLTRESALRLAYAAHDGIALAVRPAHTHWDGDVAFAFGTGEIEGGLGPAPGDGVERRRRGDPPRRPRGDGRARLSGRVRGRGVTRTLAEAAADAATCPKCRLAETRTQVVFGVGDPDADLMFIGEAPGFHEDKQGEPFVGAAGQLLTRMLGEIGLRREDVYIANVLKCRPPANRDPLPDEIETCTPWLVEQLSIIQPSLVGTLGNFATKFVLNTSQGITRLRGQTFPWHGRTVIPTFHPSAILRSGGDGSKQFELFREDFLLIGRTLEALRQPPPAEEPGTAAAGEPAAGEEQLELF